VFSSSGHDDMSSEILLDPSTRTGAAAPGTI
jgi:hypothetical protein